MQSSLKSTLSNTYEMPVSAVEMEQATSTSAAHDDRRGRYERALSVVSISDNILDKDMLRRVKAGHTVSAAASEGSTHGECCSE